MNSFKIIFDNKMILSITNDKEQYSKNYLQFILSGLPLTPALLYILMHSNFLTKCEVLVAGS